MMAEVTIMEHRSIACINESELVRMLLSDPLGRMDLLGVKGIPSDALDFQGVPLDSVPGNFKGDIDILLCTPDRPDSAIAIEVKKIKVGASAFQSGSPNRLKGFKEGVDQANRLARVGFSQVYLYVFVTVDSRERNAGQIGYKGLTQELRDKIANTTTTSDLGQRIGLVTFDFVQPMDYPQFKWAYHGGSRLERLATEVAQPAPLIAWVAQKIANHPLTPAS
jgi:hypothetical protein